MAVNKSVDIQGRDIFSQGALNAPTLRATINTTSNWTVPAGVKAIMFVLAGGGGGGSSRGNATNGGGGGGGGGVHARVIPVQPGGTVAIAVGSGGTGALANAGDTNGGSGGNSTLTYGNTTYQAYGATQYTTSGGFGQYAGGGGNGPTNAYGAAGSLPFLPYVPTNFVIEAQPYVQYYSNGSFHTNYSSNMAGGSPNTGSSTGTLPLGLVPYSGSLGSTSNLSSSNVGPNNTFGLAGGGAAGSNYSNNTGVSMPGNIGNNTFPYRGSGGITGGGGAGIPNQSGGGPGGGGHGGAGGSATAVASSFAAGGGGGLTGAGATSTSSSGGAGGTGGGGGGGAVAGGNGGAGGAGACLIYY